MKTITRLTALLVIASALAAAPVGAQTPPAAAGDTATSPTDTARQHFLRGVELFKERNFRAALVEFRRAQEIAPNWRLHYNIAQTQFELHDYAGALRAFQTYLAQGGQEVDEARKAEVQRELEKLRGRVAKVRITASEIGAEIRIDDEPAGTTPLPDPLLVSAGHVKIEARKGAVNAVRYIDVAGGDEVAVDLVLATEKASPAAAPAAAATTPASTTRPQAPPRHTGVWIGVAVTGALTAGAVVSGVLALGAKSDYDSRLNAYPGSSSEVDDARKKTKTYALLTDILGGAAIASGVVTIVLASSGSSTDEAAAPKTVRMSLGPGAVSLHGAF